MKEMDKKDLEIIKLKAEVYDLLKQLSGLDKNHEVLYNFIQEASKIVFGDQTSSLGELLDEIRNLKNNQIEVVETKSSEEDEFIMGAGE